MWMDEGEIVRDYNAAANKSEQVKILAELNGCEKKKIVEILQKNGVPVKVRKNRPKTEEEREEQAIRLALHYLDMWNKEIREHEKAIDELDERCRKTVNKFKERGVDLSTKQFYAADLPQIPKSQTRQIQQ